MEIVRVLHVLTGLHAGGTESFVMTYLRNIDKNKVIFDFLITSKNGFYEDEVQSYGCKIYRITSRRKNALKHYIEMNDFFKKHSNEYSVIHIPQSLTYSLPFDLSYKYRIPGIISHCHGVDPKRAKYFGQMFKRILGPRILEKSSDIFSCSVEAAKLMWGENIVNNDKFKVIHNAIDAHKFEFNDILRMEKRVELDLNSDFVIGYVARFDYMKNQAFLVDIFFNYLQINHQSKLLLIGKGKSLPMIRKKINKYNIQDKVIIIEESNEINVLMQTMDVFVFPSTYEGLGIVAIEAQASGLKVLASTEIPIETKITNLIEYISLNDKQLWLEKLCSLACGYKRRLTFTEIQMSNYDITIEAKKLEELYISYARS